MRNRWLMWLLVIVFGICVGAPTAAMQSSKSAITGTWTLRPKGQTTEIAAGTWKVAKK